MRFLHAIASVLAVTAVGAFGAGAARSHAAAPGLAVLAFQSDSSPPALIDRSAHALTQVGVDGVNLIGRGAVSVPRKIDLAQRKRAAADGLPAVLLVGNWSQRVSDFSERLAHETLGDPAAVTAAAAAIAHDVRRGGWNGVSVDLESLAPRDTAGLSAFVAALRAALPAGASLSVCIQASTSTAGYAADGYDLRALAAHADRIVLMTYDDHGPWENTPGPIGPLAWQRASVAALERAVPAGKILLGAADYGYDWRPHSNNTLHVAQARSLVKRWHAHARWVPAVGEWTARLRDGTTVWWSDARSVSRRIALARRLGLRGVAVWSLGTGDPIPARTPGT